MKFLLPALALMAGTALYSLLGPATAHEFAASEIKIDHPWARATVTTRQPGAVFFHLENTGKTDDTLIAVEIGSDIAEAAELHTTLNDEGIFRMRPLADGIVVPAEAEVAIQPGGHHAMLFGLTEPLVEGRSFPIVLVFKRAGRVTVEVFVETPREELTPQAPDPSEHAGHGS